MGSNPTRDTHMDVLYRQTYNTIGQITTDGLTQDNRVGNDQKKNNDRLNANTNKGILAGSVVAVVGEGLIGPCLADSTNADKAVGVAVNDALGNPYTSSSAVASERVVYAHGTGTVFETDVYEVVEADGTGALTYAAGQFVYPSQNGLLTNAAGVAGPWLIGKTVIGIILRAPSPTDAYMSVQMRI